MKILEVMVLHPTHPQGNVLHHRILVQPDIRLITAGVTMTWIIHIGIIHLGVSMTMITIAVVVGGKRGSHECNRVAWM